MEFEKDRRAPA